MTTFWDAPNGGALTGTERFGADKANSGNPADSVHYTTEQLAEFGESQNATVPRPADLDTQAAILAAQDAAEAAQDAVDAITPASIGAATVAEAGNALTAAQNAQTTADNAASAATAAQGTADNAVTAAGVAQTTADDAATAASNAQTTATAALPKPGGTTTANGIAYGTGVAGAAVAISTTTISDLVKRLGNVFTLSASQSLDDSHSGGIVFVDTSGGARSLTIPTSVSAGWNAVIVREGANTLNIIGDGTMLMAGPAAAANAVAIAVDNGGVSVIRRSATKCWCAGKIS